MSQADARPCGPRYVAGMRLSALPGKIILLVEGQSIYAPDGMRGEKWYSACSDILSGDDWTLSHDG